MNKTLFLKYGQTPHSGDAHFLGQRGERQSPLIYKVKNYLPEHIIF